MLSSHLFLCLPCLLPPFTVPCKMVLDRHDERDTCSYHFSLSLFTMVRRSSCGPIACWIFSCEPSNRLRYERRTRTMDGVSVCSVPLLLTITPTCFVNSLYDVKRTGHIGTKSVLKDRIHSQIQSYDPINNFYGNPVEWTNDA